MLSELAAENGWTQRGHGVYLVPVEWILKNVTRFEDSDDAHSAMNDSLIESKISDVIASDDTVCSIEKDGFVNPININFDNNGIPRLWDGHHRFFLALMMMAEYLPVASSLEFWPLPDMDMSRPSFLFNKDGMNNDDLVYV
jgi:hypothetical protein